MDKREPGAEPIDWSTVSYTYSVGQTWGEATSAAAVAATTPTTTAAVLAATDASAVKASTASAQAASSPAAGNVDSQSDSTALTAAHVSRLVTMGVLPGTNAVSQTADAWFGSDGRYTNEFTNDSGDDLILVIWGPGASWVNAHTPLITTSLAPGACTTISFKSGLSGAWSAIHPDTQMVMGQVSNTWGEFTFNPTGVVDVSREVNMDGHGMSVVGPYCTTDMEKCVFVCSSGTTCMTGYQLLNCDVGSQPGAQYGTDKGGPSGGCGWKGAESASFKTTLS